MTELPPDNAWSSLIEWIEKHPDFSSIVATVILSVLGGITFWIWTKLREKIRVKITIKVEEFKLNTIEDERILAFLRFRIKLLNHSRVPVSFQDFYLELPISIREVRSKANKFLPGLPIPCIDYSEGARMYANCFHLTDENGERIMAGFSLESQVTYLYAELDNPLLTENLREKDVTFVLIDHNEKKHYSNRLHLSDKKIIQGLSTR